MDWIQFPFEVDARVHAGVGAPIVRLRWLFTDQPFFPPGTQCVIRNRIWDQDQISDLSVGQLPLVKSNYEQDARWVLTPGLDRQHQCHPEWLATGEPWPTTLPPTEYDPNWIPFCCPRIALPKVQAGAGVSAAVEYVAHPWGSSCCEASVADLSTLYTRTLDGSAVVSDFWRWELPAGNYKLTMHRSGLSSFTWINQGLSGLSCSTAATFLFSTNGNTVSTFTLAVDSTVCVQEASTDAAFVTDYTLLMEPN